MTTPIPVQEGSDLARLRWLALVVTLVHLVLAWLMRSPGLGWGEDDAAFLLLSRELQHLQYHETQDILAPVHARFPPGFPLMLAVVGKVTGNRLDALFAFVALCSAASVLLFFDAARRKIGAEVAFLATGLYAINPMSLADAGSLMSEAPFKLLMVLALWGASRESDGARFAVVAGGAAILAALTRSAGVVFIPALGIYWLSKRRYTWAGMLALACLPLVAWFVFAFNAPDANDRRLYIADFMGRSETLSGALAHRVGRLVPRLKGYLTSFIPFTMGVPTISGTPIDNAIWLASFLLLGAIGLIALIRVWTPAALFLVSYGMLLIVWRYAFDRLVRPIVPLLFSMLLVGAYTLVGTYVPRYARRAAVAIAIILAFGAIRGIAPELTTRLRCDRSAPAESEACWPRPDRELLSLSGWVRDSVPDDALFFVSKERAFYVHSGRKSINQDRGLREPAESLGSYLRSRGVTHTVVTPIGVRANSHAALIRDACREFELVRRFSHTTLLLRVAPETSVNDATPACDAVREFHAREAGPP